MKLLMIGIDGGTKEILEHMPMPFTHKLFAKAKSKTLKEDLLSRGWAEILTGEHAATTKGYYLMPFNDKSYRFSRSYSKNDMLRSKKVTPLWQKINEEGSSVGILNVPTTGPAEKVNGFLVAGGGGGLGGSNSIAPSMVFPREHKQLLEKNNYIFDIRLPAGSHQFSTFANDITTAQEIQSQTFIELSEIHNPDFGFHCFRMTTELQYLARSEIEFYIENVKQQVNSKNYPEPQNNIQKKLVEHYISMDKCIEKMFTSLNPENFMFVADHSTSLYKYDVNMDVWLESNGFLKSLGSKRTFLAKVGNKLAKKTNSLKAKLNLEKAWPTYRVPSTKFSKRKTKAFGIFYEAGNFGGIYINDHTRFGGPVKTKTEIDSLVTEICSTFNNSKEAQDHNLRARPYKNRFEGEEFTHLMPEIEIDKDDSIYFSCRCSKFIESNSNYGPVPEDLTNVRYPFTGIKGRDPIFVYNNALEEYICEDDPCDLRLAYKVASRLFSKN